MSIRPTQVRIGKVRRLLESNSPIEALRLERTNLLQEDFAKACGIPLRTYHRWISGDTEAKLTVKQFKQIWTILGLCSISDIPDDFASSPEPLE